MILRVSSHAGQTRDFQLEDEQDFEQLVGIVPEVDQILQDNEDLDEAMRQIVMHIQMHGIDAEIIDDSLDEEESEPSEDTEEPEMPSEEESDDFDDEEREEQNADSPTQENSPGDEAEAEEEESYEDSDGEEEDSDEESDDTQEETEDAPQGGQEKQLSIVDAETGDPVVVIGQDETGIDVVGGDSRLVEELGLDQYDSLEEMADAINSDSEGPYQAVFEGEGGDPQVTQHQQSDTMKACLDIIKDVLSKVKARQAMEDDQKKAAAPEGKAATLMGAELIESNPEPIYVAFDADNLGNSIMRAEELNDEEALSQASAKINSGQDLFRQWAQSQNGTIVEQGGDEGMAKVPGTAINQVETFRSQYFQLVGATVTVGVGKDIRESIKARMLGKLKDKDQTVIFDDTTLRELEIRLKDVAPNEAQKISQAMAPSSNKPNQPRSV